MTDLEQPLIAETIYADFGMTKKELSDLFKADNIRDGSSIKNLERLGRLDGLMNKLQTQAHKGLDSGNVNDLELRIRNFGSNKPIVKPQKTLIEYVLENFEDRILQILCAAAAVNLVIGISTEGFAKGWMDGFAIFVAVIIIVTVTAGNNYAKDQQFRKLNAVAEDRKINIRRNGAIVQLSIHDLVVGDIVLIDTGEILPVDGVLFEASNMNIDESSLTGETDLVRKQVSTFTSADKASPFLISGSRVMEGTGEMVALAVGEMSQWGQAKLLMNAQGKDDKTPLQEKLEVLADQIGEYGLKAAILTFVAMSIHLLIGNLSSGDPLFTVRTLKEVLNFFIVSVTILVIAVPEGLPLAVTIALAYSVSKMKDENNLVRFLSACETMGGANNICSDKTGTLTENRMTVTNLYIEENDLNRIEKQTISNNTLQIFCESVALNSNANPQIDEFGKFDQIGNKTECALLEMAYKFGFDFRQLRQTNKDKIKKKVPFSSSRKRMSTIMDIKNDKTHFRIHCKGAPDILLDKCTHYLNVRGQQTLITSEYKAKVQQILKQYASQSLRSILVTYRETMLVGRPDKPDSFPNEDELETKLTIIAITGIQDPLREGIPEAVAKCKEAGVTVRMVTGDNLDTAVAISKKAGILPPSYEYNVDSLAVLEGRTFRQLVGGIIYTGEGDDRKPEVKDLANFRLIAQELRVLARSSPEDKFTLVTGLKQLENVVAVTGDGTNDAPALKKADVGFAMGIQGTEVAKEASGIILLDDNFSTIVTAIKWGRNIFDCIRKFLQFQLTVNVVAVLMAFLGGVVLKESPLTSIQMLWVNLIMDTLASLALATEPPHEDLLKRMPYGRKENMITANMWRNIICQSVFQILVLLIVLFGGDVIFGVESSRGSSFSEDEYRPERQIHYTLFFHIFVFLQVFNEINARKLKKTELNVFEGFFDNVYFIAIIVGTIIVQMLIVQYGGEAVKVTALTMHQHMACVFIGMLSLIVGYFIKLIPDVYFENFELFKEQSPIIVDPNTIQGRIKRPSTLLRKKRQIEGPATTTQVRPQEVELKMGGSRFK